MLCLSLIFLAGIKRKKSLPKLMLGLICRDWLPCCGYIWST